MKKYYITTAIDYINGKPHLGHAYEKIGADVIKRYKNQVGVQTFLLAGTDEHSTNVLKCADSLGIEPKQYCDQMAEKRVIPWGQDGNFSAEGLETTYNNDLANDYGNLISRTTAMINKFANGYLPEMTKHRCGYEMKNSVEKALLRYHGFMETMQFAETLNEVITLVNHANRYIDQSAPWQLYADNKQSELSDVLYDLVETIRISTWMLQPFMPNLKKRVWGQLGFDREINEADNPSWGCSYGNAKINRGAPLFPRIKTSSPV